ncbi:hypothetical protein [Bradyrhizobium sp. USDA 4350]
MTSYTARDIKDLHELLGWGLRDCTRAFELAFDENSDIKDILQGDVVWAAGVVHASGLAINVKGGPNARRNWNIEVGAKRAEMYRESHPALNDRFPVRATANPSPGLPG